MKKQDFGSVKMLLVMENPIIRQGLQNALLHEGYSRPFEVISHDKFLSTLVEETFDVIVTSTEVTGEFVAPFIGQMRQGGLVHHPLPVVIELLVSSDSDYVRRVIDSGPDDILQLPISPGQLLSRLAIIAEKRKPFVVTSDYIGPDRRQNARAGATTVPLIEVPNPLGMRVNRATDEEIGNAIEECKDKLRQMRLERYAFELQWLLRAIRQLFQPDQNDAEKLETFCDRIKTLTMTMQRLMPDDAWKLVSPQSEKVTMGASILLKSGFSADATVLQGLGVVINKLTQAMLATVEPEILQAAGYSAAK